MNRLSTLRKASPMSPSAARIAAMPARLPTAVLTEPPAKCSTLFALNVEHPAKFLSSPVKTVLFTAAIALQAEDKFSVSEIGS